MKNNKSTIFLIVVYITTFIGIGIYDALRTRTFPPVTRPIKVAHVCSDSTHAECDGRCECDGFECK